MDGRMKAGLDLECEGEIFPLQGEIVFSKGK
jgi:hypothetical protein